jgi:RNA polymerase sigma factor (sigma-70 family)
MANTNQTLDTLIERARCASAAMPERHQAFEEIVRRFEPLVVACAYARLRDPALAEDAAQDTFLLAWQRLDQLREPAAFPGWIRRLALTQCHRRLRGARLVCRPEDEARDSAATDQASEADRMSDETLVRRALAQLTPNDRLVLILFYGSERSHAEIADWLGVPVTTISRRLAHAKRRVRQHALDGLAGGLRGQRSHDRDAFLTELSARIRGAEPDDGAAIARLGADDVPGAAPTTPSYAYLLEDPVSGSPIAYASATQTIFRPIYDLRLAIGEEALKRHAGDVLLTQIVQDLIASDAITLQHRISARHAALVAFLRGRGFQVVERAQDWRLDATACAALAASRPRGDEWTFRGIEAISSDPGLFDEVLSLLTEAMADDPSERMFLPIHPDALHRRLRMQRDGIVAASGGRLQGLITASPDAQVPNALRLNMVLVRKDGRRHGLATAALACLLARHAGASLRLVAPEAADLTGWLTRRGFVQVADRLLLERLLRKTVALAPALLDEYVGLYDVPALPGRQIAIERHGDRLISKAGDMRDVLLASSESEFFTRHHDGRGRFERDGAGRVVRLVMRDGPREYLAIRR